MTFPLNDLWRAARTRGWPPLAAATPAMRRAPSAARHLVWVMAACGTLAVPALAAVPVSPPATRPANPSVVITARGSHVIVSAAGEQLVANRIELEPPNNSNVGAAASPAAFGPVVERDLPWDVPCIGKFLQFRTGKVFAIGDGPGDRSEHKEIFAEAERTGGLDACVTGLADGIQLAGHGCIFVRARDAKDWEALSAAETVQRLRWETWIAGVVEPSNKDFPATYLFKTAAGDHGILQILGITKDKTAANLRYKLVQPQMGAEAAAPTGPPVDPWSGWLKDDALAGVGQDAPPANKTWDVLLKEASIADSPLTGLDQAAYLRRLRTALAATPPPAGELLIRLAIGDAMILNFSHRMVAEAIPWYAQTVERFKGDAPSTGTLLAKVRLAELLSGQPDRETYRPLFTRLLGEALDAPDATTTIVDGGRFLTPEQADHAKWPAAERQRMADSGAPPDNLDQLDVEYGQRLSKERGERLAQLREAAATILARAQWVEGDGPRTRDNLARLRRSRPDDAFVQHAVGLYEKDLGTADLPRDPASPATKPATTPAEVIERELGFSGDDGLKGIYLDLDTGNIVSDAPPGDLGASMGENDSRARSAIDMTVRQVSSAGWGNSREQIVESLRGVAPVKQVRLGASDDVRTYHFRTREGSVGVLQISPVAGRPFWVKVRYRLVQLARPALATRPATSRPTSQPAHVRGTLLRVEGDNLVINTARKGDAAREEGVATDGRTELQVDGAAARIEDLKPGMYLDAVSLRGPSVDAGGGARTAVRLTVTASSPALRGTVMRIDGDKLVLKVTPAGGEPTVVTVATDAKTVVKFSRRLNPGKLDDLKPDMRVSVIPETGTAARILASPAAGTTRPAGADKRIAGELVKVDGRTLVIAPGFRGVVANEVTVVTDENTEFNLDTDPATLADLKPDMQVSIVEHPGGDAGAPAYCSVMATSVGMVGKVLRIDGTNLVVLAASPRGAPAGDRTEVTVSTDQDTRFIPIGGQRIDRLQDIPPGTPVRVIPETGPAQKIFVLLALSPNRPSTRPAKPPTP